MPGPPSRLALDQPYQPPPGVGQVGIANLIAHVLNKRRLHEWLTANDDQITRQAEIAMRLRGEGMGAQPAFGLSRQLQFGDYVQDPRVQQLVLQIMKSAGIMDPRAL